MKFSRSFTQTNHLAETEHGKEMVKEYKIDNRPVSEGVFHRLFDRYVFTLRTAKSSQYHHNTREETGHVEEHKGYSELTVVKFLPASTKIAKYLKSFF